MVRTFCCFALVFRQTGHKFSGTPCSVVVLRFDHLASECGNNKWWLTAIKIVRLLLSFSKDGLGDSLLATKKRNIILSTILIHFVTHSINLNGRKGNEIFTILSYSGRSKKLHELDRTYFLKANVMKTNKVSALAERLLYLLIYCLVSLKYGYCPKKQFKKYENSFISRTIPSLSSPFFGNKKMYSKFASEHEI